MKIRIRTRFAWVIVALLPHFAAAGIAVPEITQAPCIPSVALNGYYSLSMGDKLDFAVDNFSNLAPGDQIFLIHSLQIIRLKEIDLQFREWLAHAQDPTVREALHNSAPIRNALRYYQRGDLVPRMRGVVRWRPETLARLPEADLITFAIRYYRSLSVTGRIAVLNRLRDIRGSETNDLLLDIGAWETHEEARYVLDEVKHYRQFIMPRRR